MKRTNKLALLAAFGMALAGLSLNAQPQAGDATQDVPPGPPHARFGEVLQGIIHQYDVNKDGALDANEMATLQQDVASGKVQPPGPPAGAPGRFGGPQRHLPKEILDQYDANKDGQLDDTERAALRKDIESGKIPAPAGGPGPRGPLGERPTASQILKQFDANKDGMLDETELNAFLDSRPGPGPMHRRGGGPPFGQQPPAHALEQQ